MFGRETSAEAGSSVITHHETEVLICDCECVKDWFYDTPPPPEPAILFNKRFTAARYKEGYYWKQSIQIFSRVQRCVDRCSWGVEEQRISGDTIESWGFWNRRFRWKKVRGLPCRTTPQRTSEQKKMQSQHCATCALVCVLRIHSLQPSTTCIYFTGVPLLCCNAAAFICCSASAVFIFLPTTILFHHVLLPDNIATW